MSKVLAKVKKDYPGLVFKADAHFCWSPKTGEVLYEESRLGSEAGTWALLHEVGHALLDHSTYESDLELIQLEAAAWEKAKEISPNYRIVIDEDHVQDCLDTYRDWLHGRSACPTCNTRSLQQDSRNYRCFNCGQTWTVSSSRFCRPYRRKEDQKETSPPGKSQEAMFT